MAIKKKKENEVSTVLTPMKSNQETSGQTVTQTTGQFSSPLTAQKNQAMNAYLNRDPFQYDFNADALYQHYKDKYIQQGQQAMQDTMGQAAALTGGYGSSYAQNVGQQAYNQHLSQLNDVVPKLYQLAYDRYQNEGQQLYQKYGLLAEEEEQDYNRWYQAERDAVADQKWSQEQQEQQRQFDLNYGLDQQKYAENQRQFDLNYGLDQQKYAENQRQFDLSYGLDQQKYAENQRQFDLSYGLDQQKYAENQRQFDLSYGLDQQKYAENQRQFDLNYGLDQQKYAENQRQFDLNYGLDQQKYAENQRQFDLNYGLDQQKYAEDKRQFDLSHSLAQSKANSGTTANTYQSGYHGWLAQYQGQGKRPDPNDPTQITKYDNGGVSTGNILAMQRVIGVKEDGMWSKTSQDAAGGLSADEAWAAFQKGQLQNRQSVALGDMGDNNEKIRAMERALRTNPDGVWDSWDAAAAGGRTPDEAWELYQRGLLQNR